MTILIPPSIDAELTALCGRINQCGPAINPKLGDKLFTLIGETFGKAILTGRKVGVEVNFYPDIRVMTPELHKCAACELEVKALSIEDPEQQKRLIRSAYCAKEFLRCLKGWAEVEPWRVEEMREDLLHVKDAESARDIEFARKIFYTIRQQRHLRGKIDKLTPEDSYGFMESYQSHVQANREEITDLRDRLTAVRGMVGTTMDFLEQAADFASQIGISENTMERFREVQQTVTGDRNPERLKCEGCQKLKGDSLTTMVRTRFSSGLTTQIRLCRKCLAERVAAGIKAEIANMAESKTAIDLSQGLDAILSLFEGREREAVKLAEQLGGIKPTDQPSII